MCMTNMMNKKHHMYIENFIKLKIALIRIYEKENQIIEFSRLGGYCLVIVRYLEIGGRF